MMKRKAGNALASIAVWLMAVIFMAPLLLVVINSFKTKGEIMTSAIAIYMENFRTILTDDHFGISFLFSIGIVTVTTSLTVLVAAVTGYALARWESFLCRILVVIIMSTLFVPFQVYMVALIVVVRDIGLINHIVGLVMVYIALGMPVPIFLCRSYCVGMSREIEEAAVIDGCSKGKMVPLMKPILATVAVLNALWVWGEFLVAFLVYGNGKPMTLPLSQRYFYGTYSNQWNLILTNFLISSIPVVLFYILMQKHIIKGVAAGAVKG